MSATLWLLLLYNLPILSHTDTIVGDYYCQAGDKDLVFIAYNLTLHQDGTFMFHAYTDHQNSIPPYEENNYGKGTWQADKKVVTFFTDKETDMDEKHTLNFSNSKAHFITKPPRDKTDRVIKTRLKFFESDIFWIKGWEIFKK
ncbi:MAG: hypothetical protein KJO73_07725 [Croceitalea sp.]|nr:hypothetical protein [Croceitalea sp.]NNC35128.1 hypothetical protein [Croceitalea sp.]